MMPTKLSTTVKKIELVPNSKNSELIHKFQEFLKSNSASERHQNNNLKAVCNFANFLGQNTDLEDIKSTNQILSFLNTKIKSQDEDPDKNGLQRGMIIYIELNIFLGGSITSG